MAIRRCRLAVALGGALTLFAAAPALAVDPPASMVGMPDPATIGATFTGSDALDTAAIQFAAFLRLDVLAGRLVPANRLPTLAEIQFQHAYDDGWTALVRQVKASLPSDQQAYIPGTRFTAWYGQIDQYSADPGFNRRFRALFTAAFLQAHAAIFADLEQSGKSPTLPPPVPTAPPITTQIVNGAADNARYAVPRLLPLALILGLLALVGIGLPTRRQPKGR